MSVIDDLLETVAEPDSPLFSALDRTVTASCHLKQAMQRRDGSLGAERVLQRAQAEVRSARRLARDLEDPFQGLFNTLLGQFPALDAYRAAALDDALDEAPHPDGGSAAYEYAADELEYAKAIARQALVTALSDVLVAVAA